VKAVPPYAAIRDRFRQGECLRDRRRSAVEGRVEARDLRQLGRAREQHPDSSQVVRLVQWRQRYVLFQRRQHGRVETYRMRIFEATVHDTMPHADEAVLGELGTHEGDQVIERAIVAELDPLTPGFFTQDLARAVLGHEPRRGVQAFCLAARGQIQHVAARHEQRELEAR
jgi:hypothetical protein